MTTYQIRVDKELKNNFLKTTKERGFNGSTIIRYFMENYTQKPEIVNFTVEKDFLDGIMDDKKIVSKLGKISNKLDDIGF